MQKIQKVILVFKTHFDIGFTDLSEKVLQQYAGPMLRDVLETCEKTTDMGELAFKWTMPAWPLKYMLENAESDLLPALEKMVRSGRIVWHALPFTSHTDFSSEQEMLQSLRYGRELSKKFSRPITKSAKMTDVPGHGRILPSILAQGGVEFLHLGCNEFATSPKVPTLFYWQAPDNEKVLTMYCADGYGSGFSPPDGWQYPVWMAFMHTHDNIGPQNAESIHAIVAEMKLKHPGAEVVTGTMDDFYEELAKHDLSAVPVVTQDLADTWIHGVGSYPKEVGKIREARRKLALCTYLGALTKQEYNPETEQSAQQIHDKLIMFSEHTWGLDVKTWLGSNRVYKKQEFLQACETKQYKYIEASWQEQKTRAKDALYESEHLLKGLQSGQDMCAVNPTGGDYSGWMQVLPSGEDALPEVPLEMLGGKYLYIENIPPLSSKTLGKCKIKDSAATLVIRKQKDSVIAENHRYVVDFSDKKGTINSVFDKKLGKNILAKSKQNSVFAYRYDKYGSENIEKYLEDYGDIWSAWGIKDNGRENYPETMRETFAPQFTSWRAVGSSIEFLYSGTACASYGDAEEIKLILTLPPYGEELFVELKLSSKQATPFVESGSLVFPLAEISPEYVIGKNGCPINPKTDIAKNANHAFYCVDTFMAAEKQGSGVCIVPFDTPLAAIGETGVYTFRDEYKENNPEYYSNIFNNMWGTNFPQWINGDFSFRYAVFGYSAEENIADISGKILSGAAICKTGMGETPLNLPAHMRVQSLVKTQRGLHLIARSTVATKRRISLSVNAPYTNIQVADIFGSVIGEHLPSSELVVETEPYDSLSILIT